MTVADLNAKLRAEGFTPSAAGYESESSVYAFSVESDSAGMGTFGHPARTYCYIKSTGQLTVN